MTLNLVGEWSKELEAAVRSSVDALGGEIELPAGDVNLKLIDDAEIKELNKNYNGNAYSTDVLTFAYREEDPDNETLADIAISKETALRQSQAAGTSIADEVALLAVHGILHALGYDHGDDEGQAEIEGLQQSAIKKAGLNYREFKWQK